MVLEVSGILGEQSALSVDTLVRNAVTAGLTKDYSSNQTARANLDAPQHNVSYADVVKGIATLEAANALPVEGNNFVLVIHPHTFATLMQDPVFVNLFIQEAPNSPLRAGGFEGTILRCNVYVTSNQRKYVDAGVGGTTDVYSMTFIGKEAFGICGIASLDPNVPDGGGAGEAPNTGKKGIKAIELIVKPLGSAGASDPLNQRGTIGWKAAFDNQVLNSAFGLDLEHTTVFSDD